MTIYLKCSLQTQISVDVWAGHICSETIKTIRYKRNPVSGRLCVHNTLGYIWWENHRKGELPVHPLPCMSIYSEINFVCVIYVMALSTRNRNHSMVCLCVVLQSYSSVTKNIVCVFLSLAWFCNSFEEVC